MLCVYEKKLWPNDIPRKKTGNVSLQMLFSRCLITNLSVFWRRWGMGIWIHTWSACLISRALCASMGWVWVVRRDVLAHYRHAGSGYMNVWTTLDRITFQISRTRTLRLATNLKIMVLALLSPHANIACAYTANFRATASNPRGEVRWCKGEPTHIQ